MAKVKSQALKPLYPQQLREPRSWLVGLIIVAAMLFGHWKLLLATSIGASVMLLVYVMQEWDWQRYWSSVRQFLNGSNRQLTLAVCGGGVATLSTYMAISIWIDSKSPWIALATTVSVLGTLAILTLLVWQAIDRQANQDEVDLDPLLSKLTDTNPVKRLVAVRQLTRWGADSHLHPSERRVVADCFRLMLTHEQEAVIRGAVLDGLEVLDNNRRLNKGTQPLQLPVQMKQSAEKIRHQ
jgi:hypothetical protein